MTTSIVGEDRLLIDGKLVPAGGGKTYDNVNPATESVLGQAADAGSEDVEAAIAAARRAFDETDWSTNVAFRVHCLRQLQAAFERHADEIKAMTIAEVGLPAALVDTIGFEGPVNGIGWVAELAEKYEWAEDHGVVCSVGQWSHRWAEREAVGVVGAITPWNQPTQVNLAKVAPALAAGNTVVLKAAPATPWCAAWLGRLAAEETDIPPGVFNVITSSANDRGRELVESPQVDLISFTGSTAVGRKITALGAETVKKVFLELGGKSAHLVLDDIEDLAMAVMPSVFQVIAHGGQGCTTLSRLLLPKDRFDEGIDAVVAMMGAMPYGDPTDPANMMGPLIHGAHRERVEGMVARAVDDGATVVTGGKRPSQLPTGFYYEPTLLVNVGPDDFIAQNEIFGPVLVAIAYDGEDEGVRIANNTIYGLSGGVASGDHERAKRVARRIRAGTLIVDGGMYYGPDVPFGGYKQSGVGREMGRLGFEEYTEVKLLAEPAEPPADAA